MPDIIQQDIVKSEVIDENLHKRFLKQRRPI